MYDSDISKKQDRGVLKRIIKIGTGEDVPSVGCVVKVHYTGTLEDGTKFDSSKDRNEPFKFVLGVDQVIKAWDIGIATMKKGEVCMLTCAPDYAYGANGSPPKIPPNATLKFEIEMLDWELEDLSPNENKGILRNIIEAGEGSSTPNDGALVHIDLEARIYGDNKLFDKRQDITFNLGEGTLYDICEGVEIALQKFKSGEMSKLIIQPRYGFKAEGHDLLIVPPNAVLEYVIKLKGFDRLKDPWMLDEPELIERGKDFKAKGTEYFKDNKYDLAITMYKRSLNFLTDVKGAQKDVATELLISTYLNLSLCYLKETPPAYFEANEQATKALELDPENVKGMFRRGQALLGMEDVSKAMEDFQKVLVKEPNNKAAANQIAVCKAKLLQQKQNEKKLYANMFDKFAKHDSEAEKIRAKAEVDVIGEKVGEWGIGEGEWTDQQRDRKPTEFEKENPNILMLDKDGQFQNM